jgi:non-specific serine/threonine protein kinase
LKGRGDFERALEIYEEGIRQCRESGDPTLLASILAHVAYTFMLQGDLERAAAVGEEAAAMLREQEHRFYLAEVLYTLGWVALLQSNHKRAKSLYEESLRLCLEVGDKVAVPGCLEALACAVAARGEAERVATLFGSAQAQRKATGYHEASAEQALREPYLGVARSRLNEASWKAAFVEGQAMELEEAVDYVLSEELPPFSTSPAPKQPSDGGKSASLTRREEKIATLVARGLTNRQIASELAISEHTVANHVAKILRKLGLDSRSQITAWMVERRTPP